MSKIKHGLSNTLEYQALHNAINRCYNPRCKDYKNYGARHITVCDRWLGPDGIVKFYNDIGPRPSSKHTIDRINNDSFGVSVGFLYGVLRALGIEYQTVDPRT